MTSGETIVDDADTAEDSQAHSTACTRCRRKKQKCSKDDPCRSCAASGSICTYEEGQRRGAKAGYIESIVKRMETLEAIVLGQSLLLSPLLAQRTTHGDEINSPAAGGLEEQLQTVREKLLEQRQQQQVSQGQTQLKKRPRTRSLGGSSALSGNGGRVDGATEIPRHLPLNGSETQPILPPASMLQDLVTIYFDKIHPWIPILHQPSFEAAMLSTDGQKPSVTVLQAITAAAIKFLPLDPQTQEWYHHRCHDAIVLACMDRFSVESLQASIIIAFNTIGSGRGPRSWSIVASATRIVEQLGLAIEEEDAAENRLLNRVGFLPPAKNWTEAESLRRIFWCIFLFDRFCSVATGWNTSLTSTDVKRRLPVEGCLWRDGTEARGRYFNIADHGVDSEDETNVLGGFAYLIEASECMTRVVTFLLQESVDFSARDGLRRWFERFQTLDAMLIRWKTFLPARWRVASIDMNGLMDENLTLAHIMHNASVIMLHQNVAYPDAKFRLHLPSQDAAKTCVAAAGEIATIAAKFIANSTVIIPPTMSFCLFVAARALLAHANHQLGMFPIVITDPNFDTLLQCLRESSTRWRAQSPSFASENLAGQFADRIDAAVRSHSPINVRSAALQEDRDMPVMSLASPPFPDVFRFSSVNSPMGIVDANGIGDAFSIPSAGLEAFDRIFTWTDELTG
ncbi:Transcription factor [Niveomyces insectorum RCEF 264]|uniref:Transcription factor n=1 Tax=Niveomyces insectorum RCEF 264 TaxID=1081102 RepID=A0A167RTF8_9HYPO|nr:Transcription factor [Niveomyces insectorum RCEF 264]